MDTWNFYFCGIFICSFFYPYANCISEYKVKAPGSNINECTHGIKDQLGNCICKPCWKGSNCDIPVNNYAPKFSNEVFEVDIKNSLRHLPLFTPKVIDNDRRETCKDDYCPCAETYFSITSGNDDGLFTVNPRDGSISVSQGVRLDKDRVYTVELSVRNQFDKRPEMKDSTTIIFEYRGDPEEIIEQLRGFENSAQPHHRVKRGTGAAPQNVTFTLVKVPPYDNTENLWIGSRVKFELTVSYPVGTTDMLIELFTPDNDTTVMILCDVVVTPGPGLTIGGSTAVTMDSKTPGSVLHDRAIINLGAVTVNNCDVISDCSIVITYEAIMVDDSIQNGSIYWVSAGAEYNNANEVWVGQASFATIADTLAQAATSAFNFTGPELLPIGSAGIYEVVTYLPYPSTVLSYDVFAPLNTSSVMSVCSASLAEVGSNLKCGFDESAVSSTAFPDSNGLGNSIVHLNIGKMFNKASRDIDLANTADNSFKIQMVFHLYNDPSFIGQQFWLGAALEMGTTQIWAGQFQVTATAPVDPTGMNAPTLSIITVDDNVQVDTPKEFTLEAVLPEDTTSTYELTVQTQIANSLPKFQLCRVSIKSIGGNMPCVLPADKKSVYSSTVNASHSDKGILNLGSISNVALSPGNTTENTITFEIIVTPLTHTAVTQSSSHDVSMTLTYGAGLTVTATRTFTVTNTAGAAALSNTTAPSFNMTFFDGNENINVGAATKIYYDITTNQDVTYPKMDIEAILPIGNTSTKLSVCRARMTSVGENLPCVVPAWVDTLFTYSSRYNDGKNDRVILSLPKVCNKQYTADDEQDLMRFEFDVKVEDHADLLDGTKEWISAGNMYSDVKIWVGQLAMYAKRPASIGPTTTPYLSLYQNSTFSSVPIGMPVVYSLLIKVHPGESIDLNIIVNSANAGLGVCGIRLKEVGDNFPCVDKTAVLPTFSKFASGGGNTQGVLNMGIITNTGSTPVATNDYFDSNSLIFEVIMTLSSDTSLVADAQSFSFSADVTTTTGGSATTLSKSMVATYDMSSFNSTILQSGQCSFNVGAIGDNDTEYLVAKGEGKRFIAELELPEGETQKISVSFLTPVLSPGVVEICDAAVISVGSHFPCIDKTTLLPTFQSRTGSLYNDIATIDLGYVCSSASTTGIPENNKIQIEAVARLLPNAPVNTGDGVFFHVTVTTNDAQIYVSQINMTVTDTFVEKYSSPSLNNETTLEVNTTASTIMKIGEVVTFPLVLYVPALSASNVIIDASIPINGTAVAIVKDMRLVSAGKNIKCLYEDTAKGFLFTPVYNSTLDNCENDKGYIDLGIVTNAGLSYRRGDAEEIYNAVNLDVDVVLSDTEYNEDAVGFNLNFGAKVGPYIFLVDHAVTVSRTGNEKPVLTVDAAVNDTLTTSTNIVVDAILQHDSNSTSAAAVNASVMFYLPPYLMYSSMTANTSYSTRNQGGIVAIDFETVLFCDGINIQLTLIPNNSISVPEDILTDTTVLSYQAGTSMIFRANSVYNADEFFTTDIKQVNFSATVYKEDVCDGSLGLEDGRIDDCQIFSSVEDESARPAFHGRYNGASAWSPFKRGLLFDNLRFFQVYFGNKTLVTKVIVQQPTGFTHYPTKLTLTYSDDGYAWQDGEIVTLTVPFSEFVVNPTRLVESRYFRIYITEDNAGGAPPNLGVRFGLYGCFKSNDAPADICGAAPKRAFPTDYYERSFGLGNGKVIVCDVNPKMKDSPSVCHSSTTGSDWTRLKIVGSLLGYDPDDDKWFGYANNKDTTVMSVDGGATWESTSRDTYLLSRDKPTFQASKKVPWQSTNLDAQSVPHTTYQLSDWGATFNGMMKNSLGIWTTKLEWDQCCV